MKTEEEIRAAIKDCEALRDEYKRIALASGTAEGRSWHLELEGRQGSMASALRWVLGEFK